MIVRIVLSGLTWQREIKLAPSLPLLPCELSLSVKENADRKKVLFV